MRLLKSARNSRNAKDDPIKAAGSAIKNPFMPKANPQMELIAVCPMNGGKQIKTKCMEYRRW